MVKLEPFKLKSQVRFLVLPYKKQRKVNMSDIGGFLIAAILTGAFNGPTWAWITLGLIAFILILSNAASALQE